jgi:hypothetical protein
MSSAIYFGGPDFCKQRITRLLTRKQNGQMYKKAELRQQWVTHMKNENKNQKPLTEMELKELFDWITNTRIKPDDLIKIISRNDSHENQLTTSNKKTKRKEIWQFCKVQQKTRTC